MIEEQVDFKTEALNHLRDAIHAWEHDRDEPARTLAILALANAAIAVAEALREINKNLEEV